MPATLRPFLRQVRAATGPETYCVGGFLRDLLLGRPANDLDLALVGPPSRAAAAGEALARSFGGKVFALDEERGQQRVLFGGRAPVPYADLGPMVPDMREDLGRRDLTVDALAARLEEDGSLAEVVDPMGGLADLRAGVLRLTSESALREDPLRLLRTPRLAVELGFAIDEDTARTIGAARGLLAGVPGERLRDELARVLSTERGAQGLRLIDRLGLLRELMPEVTAGRGVSQPERFHHYDVFDHAIETVAALDAMLALARPEGRRAGGIWEDFRSALAWWPLDRYLAVESGGVPRPALIKLAGLLHDAGKPATRGEDETGRVRFLGHAAVGASLAQGVCRRLRLGGAETRFITLLVEEHLRPAQLGETMPPTRRAVFRYFRALADAAPACLFLSIADALAAGGPRIRRRQRIGFIAFAAYILARGEELAADRPPPRLIRGDALMRALGLRQGPVVGRLLAAIEEAAAAGEVTDEAGAIQYARRLLESESGLEAAAGVGER